MSKRSCIPNRWVLQCSGGLFVKDEHNTMIPFAYCQRSLRRLERREQEKNNQRVCQQQCSNMQCPLLSRSALRRMFCVWQKERRTCRSEPSLRRNWRHAAATVLWLSLSLALFHLSDWHHDQLDSPSIGRMKETRWILLAHVALTLEWLKIEELYVPIEIDLSRVKWEQPSRKRKRQQWLSRLFNWFVSVSGVPDGCLPISVTFACLCFRD